MDLNMLKEINWVDILVVIFAIRTIFVAVKTGFLVDIFKLLGTISAIYLGMHYYTRLSDLARGMIKIEDKMPLEFLDFICFVLLALAGYLIFWGLRTSFKFFFKAEAVPALSKWGGLLSGAVRTILLISLLMFMLVISSVPYLKDSVSKSYSGKKIFNIAPATYFYVWKNFFSKFVTNEKSNNTILEVQRDFKI